MNNQVKFEKALEELNGSTAFISFHGKPPEDDFTKLCQYVNTWMMSKYKLNDENHINQGYCFIWAYLVWALWPGEGVTFKTATGHVVVRFNNKFYDSEHVEGEMNTMGFCGFYPDATHKVIAVKEMCWFWSRCGKKKAEFRRLIRKLQPSFYNQVRDGAKKAWNDTVLEYFSGYKEIDNLQEVA